MMKNIEEPRRFIELYTNAQQVATACGTHVPRQRASIGATGVPGPTAAGLPE